MAVADRLEALVAAHDEVGSPLRACLRPGLREHAIAAGHFSYEDGHLEPPSEDLNPLDWLAVSARSHREPT